VAVRLTGARGHLWLYARQGVHRGLTPDKCKGTPVAIRQTMCCTVALRLTSARGHRWLYARQGVHRGFTPDKCEGTPVAIRPTRCCTVALRLTSARGDTRGYTPNKVLYAYQPLKMVCLCMSASSLLYGTVLRL
jgi:hypothetical protein